MPRFRRVLVAICLVFVTCRETQAASCTPQDLMAKVSLATELLERQMQQPSGARRAVAARMRGAMARHQAGVTDYQGVCDAYDDLIAQLR